MSQLRSIKITGWCSECQHGLERHDDGVCMVCGHQCWGTPVRVVPDWRQAPIFSTSMVTLVSGDAAPCTCIMAAPRYNPGCPWHSGEGVE